MESLNSCIVVELTLLEIMSFVTTHYAIGMQLSQSCL